MTSDPSLYAPKIVSADVDKINRKTWYRAVHRTFRQVPLDWKHTYSSSSRFGTGLGTYPVLYLAPSRLDALLEVRQLIRVSKFLLPNPFLQSGSYLVFPIRVELKRVMDFGNPSVRSDASTTVQELTGNWRQYGRKMARNSVSQVRYSGNIAPTQHLGAVLARYRSEFDGFLSPSAVYSAALNLVLFPDVLNIDEHRLCIKSRI